MSNSLSSFKNPRGMDEEGNGAYSEGEHDEVEGGDESEGDGDLQP
jgi:hypothetical protein